MQISEQFNSTFPGPGCEWDMAVVPAIFYFSGAPWSLPGPVTLSPPLQAPVQTILSSAASTQRDLIGLSIYLSTESDGIDLSLRVIDDEVWGAAEGDFPNGPGIVVGEVGGKDADTQVTLAVEVQITRGTVDVVERREASHTSIWTTLRNLSVTLSIKNI
jgi:hypothetical protein